ncbi:hypothetical protein V8J82_05930 [Gymnodinialimonas sp. 2305UL16-5]|uniref:hypothetical protein n=1 Tax=Gymnodinialimonas mytili TaxID=3126503 RepID=UPI0030950119
MTHLHVFAVNEPVSVSHTNLTRQKGETPALPPLTEWLGIDALDTDAIEIFLLSDLGGMALSDYIQLAFTPETGIPAEERARLDALEGAVLLVPETAMQGTTRPNAKLTLVATIALAEPDNNANLPKATLTPSAPKTPHTEPARESVPPIALYALLGIAAFAALVILFGWN